MLQGYDFKLNLPKLNLPKLETDKINYLDKIYRKVSQGKLRSKHEITQFADPMLYLTSIIGILFGAASSAILSMELSYKKTDKKRYSIKDSHYLNIKHYLNKTPDQIKQLLGDQWKIEIDNNYKVNVEHKRT